MMLLTSHPTSFANKLATLLLPLAVFFSLIVLLHWLNADQRGADYFYDFDLHSWPYKDNWWVSKVLHDYAQNLIVVIAVLSAVLASSTFKYSYFCKWRRQLVYLVTCLVLCSSSIAILKKISNRPCPYQTVRYGGTGEHRMDLIPLPLGQQLNKKSYACFPAAHSGTVFGLFALYFILVKRRRRLASLAFFSVLGLGAIYSFTQLARGAHFLSHNLWSAIICWLICWALDQIFTRYWKSGVTQT